MNAGCWFAARKQNFVKNPPRNLVVSKLSVTLRSCSGASAPTASKKVVKRQRAHWKICINDISSTRAVRRVRSQDRRPRTNKSSVKFQIYDTILYHGESRAGTKSISKRGWTLDGGRMQRRSAVWYFRHDLLKKRKIKKLPKTFGSNAWKFLSLHPLSEKKSIQKIVLWNIDKQYK